MANNIWIEEILINRDRNCRFAENEPYESFTDHVGKLFRSLQQEWGKCVSKIYRDFKGGRTREVGWVFQSRQKYTDSNDTYIREVWITLHKCAPTVVHQVTNHNFFLDKEKKTA